MKIKTCSNCGEELFPNGSAGESDNRCYYKYDFYTCKNCGSNFFIRTRYDLVNAETDNLEEM